MTAASFSPEQDLSAHRRPYGNYRTAAGRATGRSSEANPLEAWLESVAACPWGAHAGLQSFQLDRTTNAMTAPKARAPLYTAEQRRRRDASPWTVVQAVLAPMQFFAFAVSLVLIARYILTGFGYEAATTSILVKTIALYAIMVTGSIWEKAVFGKWLFARAFFWEDVFSMIVLALQTAYVGSLMLGLGSPRQQMMIALAAYGAYAINAAQFLLKLRAARLEGASRSRPVVRPSALPPAGLQASS